MHRVLIAAAAMVTAATVVHAYESVSLPDSGSDVASVASGISNVSSPGPTLLLPGDRVPRFSYLDERSHWRPFDQLRANRAVLILFGADAATLSAIELRRAEFAGLGIEPVLVLDLGSGSVSAWLREHACAGPVFNDPKGAIAGLFNTVDPATHRHAPSYFVLDERGAIRRLWRGPLPDAEALLAEAGRCLGRVRSGGGIEEVAR